MKQPSMDNIIPGKTVVRLKYDHPSGGALFTVAGRADVPGFYRLFSRYQVDSVSKFRISHAVIAHETEFEIIDGL